MICPYCAYKKTYVVGVSTSTKTERFRKCPKCGKSFQTIEAVKFDDYWKKYAKELEDTKEDSNER